jgi:hypothetical protein
MNQEQFANYIVLVLKEFNIESTIKDEPDDPRNSFLNVIIKGKDERGDLFFHTYAYGCQWNLIQWFMCYYENVYEDRIIFEVSFKKLYNTKKINSSSAFAHSYIDNNKVEETTKLIKEMSREKIIDILKNEGFIKI